MQLYLQPDGALGMGPGEPHGNPVLMDTPSSGCTPHHGTDKRLTQLLHFLTLFMQNHLTSQVALPARLSDLC